MPFFESLFLGYWKLLIYPFYKKKYIIGSLRFNGYCIRISGSGKVYSGHGSYISFYSYINVASQTSLKLGKNVSIGHNVKIYTSGINVENFITKQELNSQNADVFIGDNTLIGSNTFILPGTKIGNNVMVGANSVVGGSFPDNCVIAGAPARILKKYLPRQ